MFGDRPLSDDELYCASAIDRRSEIYRSGSLRERVAYSCFPRPHLAFGLLVAADIARYFGFRAITAIEFGIGEGDGLREILHLSKQVTKATDIFIHVMGFDGFEGLPAPSGWRDHPEFWSHGDFYVEDKATIESSFRDRATIVVGPIAQTLSEFEPPERAPIGFISFDVDTFSSTRDSLKVFDMSTDHLMPIVTSYFDDIMGSGTRLSSVMRNSRCGQLAAVAEFNANHERRVIDPLYVARHRIVFAREPWIERVYGCHVLDHPARHRTRAPLSTKAWQAQDELKWPIR